MPITRASFLEIVERVHTIPSLPEVVTQVCRLVNDPNANAREIHDIVIKDPGMAAKMLRMVNSVFYGLKEPVGDLEQALTILGFRTIRSIALSISVINLFQQQNAAFNMRAFWTHSAVSASLSRLIAERSRACDPELAFIIGLLKDVGKLVLVQNAPDEMRKIMAVAREFSLPFHRAAHEVLETDDAEIGAWLCQRWELDPSLVTTVRWQHDLTQASKPGPVAVCQLVEYLCALKNLRSPGNHDQPQLDPLVWQHLGLDRTLLTEILLAVNQEATNARQLLQLAG